MIGTKRLTPVIVVLLLAAAAAWSQPAADTQNDSTTSAPQPDAATEADTGDAAAEPTPSQTGRPPGDYRASEQISEDLSVSFPVDI